MKQLAKPCRTLPSTSKGMCAGALWLAAASRWPVRGLPLLFLWAFPKATLDTHGPRPQTLLGSRQACPGLSVAVRSLPLLFTHGPRPQTFLQAAAWPTKLLLWASEGNAASLWPVRSLPLLFTHGPRPQTFLQAAAWPTKLFLWASEGNVRHPRARPSNAPRRSLPLLFTHGPRPQTFLQAAAWPTKLLLWASEGNAASLWPVRSLPLLFTHGPRPQTFLQAAAWPTKLFLWASEGNVRHPRARPSNAPRQRAGLPRPLCGLSEACPKLASSLHPRAPPANVSAGRSLAHKAFSMGFRRQRWTPTGPALKRSSAAGRPPQSFFYGLSNSQNRCSHWFRSPKSM